MSAFWPLALLPGVVALAALTLPGGHRRASLRLAPLAPLAAMPLAVAGPRAGSAELPWLLLGSTLDAGGGGRALLLVAALVYAAALAATPAGTGERRAAFGAFLLACWLGNALLLLAADAPTFYVGFAVMGLAAYGLVVHQRTPAARRAGRVYLVMTLLGELTLLAGLLLVVAAGGRDLAAAPAALAGSPHRDLAVTLLLVGFGVKAGLVPLHLWLPLAHPAAPAPGSAVLSGCMVKAGLVGMLNFLPLGEAAMPVTGAVVASLGLTAAFGAVAVGLTQRDPKANLAYSTVSQMGVHLVLVGVALAAPELAAGATAAALLYAVHHGIAKAALFLGVGVHTIYGSRGIVRVGLALAALAVAGAPLTSGAAAKYSAKAAVADAGPAGLELVAVLPLVGIGSTLLLLRFLLLLPATPARRVVAGPPGLLGSWLLLVLVGAPATWFVAVGWLPEAPAPTTRPGAAWAALWPVLVGLAAAGAALAARRRRPLRVPAVPAGDLAVPAEAGARILVAWMRRAGAHGLQLRLRRVPVTAAVLRGERRLQSWESGGVAMLLFVLTIAAALGIR